jgi:hypothetical protein
LSDERALRPRPYWHVDAKWIVGLLLTLVLALTLLAFSLWQVTAEKPAVDTLSMLLAMSFSRNGLDDEGEIAEFRRMLQDDPDGEVRPFPQLAITVREEDLVDRTPRELRLWIFRQLAEPIYRGGAEGLGELATDAETQAAIGQGIGIASVFSRQTHDQLQRVLTVLALVSAALLIPLIYFSYRFGRLGSPGCVLFVSAIPGAVLFGFLGWIFNPPPPEVGAEPSLTGMIGSVASTLLPPIARLSAQVFLAALAIGALLLVLSMVGGLAFRRRKDSTSAEVPAPSSPT